MIVKNRLFSTRIFKHEDERKNMINHYSIVVSLYLVRLISDSHIFSPSPSSVTAWYDTDADADADAKAS